MQPATEPADPEASIMECVRGFYGEAQQDPILGPIFAAEVHDWEMHYKTIANFWSRALLGTDRYSGHPFSLHTKLPVEPEHFDRWLALFAVATKTYLPPRSRRKGHGQGQSHGRKFQGRDFSLHRCAGTAGAPAGLTHKREREFARRVLTLIKVNGTYYSTFKLATFAKWPPCAEVKIWPLGETPCTSRMKA